jgi:hypothetical protein
MITSLVPHDLREYFNRIFRPKKLLGKSPRTVKIYGETFNRFGEFLGHNPTLDNLCDESICGYAEWRMSAGRAFHTVDKELDKLIALATFAAKKRHIAEFVDIPKLQPPEQLADLLATRSDCDVAGSLRRTDRALRLSPSRPLVDGVSLRRTSDRRAYRGDAVPCGGICCKAKS